MGGYVPWFEAARASLVDGEATVASYVEQELLVGADETIANEFRALLNQAFKPKLDADFLKLLNGEFAEQMAADGLIAKAEQAAAQAALDAGGNAVAEETTTSLLELAGGGAGIIVTLGLTLVLEAEKLIINRVNRWRLDIALATAASHAGAVLVSAINEAIRDFYPDPAVHREPQPWSTTWPEEDLPRREDFGAPRYRRMGRKRK